ncbi:MAG TPA: VOC family protein [Thermoleophilaceae bacterium]
MEQRVSVITLGVEDIQRSQRFYEALGWQVGNDSEAQGVAFFQAGGLVFALWGRDELAEDSGVEPSPAGPYGGITLAHNVRSPAEVDRVIGEAEAAGATITRRPGETFYGGYSGVFVDFDGYPWEVAHNPHWTIAEDGSVTF